ncbi:unnamed protein product [Didymodactylos carnosus]|uniref:Uncharacterized protein n=1 Tax=Didymodactylos carnosus TaxID=1234261 RepID=A0A813QI20_9BILA|nr:unnamed protein product [Didymodactylos carnosus]CAF0909326.1 unnamed protein product [Didymodactylos carnosus]CAF3549480.1 unnamed protein product [Didymodactylos carnosus]CAF3688585.1 unnamed protein product [Didymodactylos carnosus]
MCSSVNRYRYVPYPSCALRLLSLEIDVINEYHRSIISSDSQQQLEPLSKQFCSLLNSIGYVADVIEQWRIKPFLYDLNKGWLRVCNEYFPPNEILLFIRCRESAILLTMPVGSALLLKDTLVNQSSSTNSRKIGKINSPLNELGIHHLNENEVQHVLERRTDLANL